MTFKVGDSVVYPSQGAGVVAEQTTREVLGEKQDYLKIGFIRGDMQVLVPLQKTHDVGLRHTVTAEEVQKLHSAIRKADLPLPSQWPPRYRAEQDILARGDAYELAKLIGVLSDRDVEKGLAGTEREILERAKELLSSELAVVQSLSLREAAAQIEATIEEKAS